VVYQFLRGECYCGSDVVHQFPGEGILLWLRCGSSVPKRGILLWLRCGLSVPKRGMLLWFRCGSSVPRRRNIIVVEM